MPHKRWLIPLALVLVAAVLIVSGIGWAIVTGVAIPDQDPTPAMQAYTRFHDRVVNFLLLGGAITFAAAIASVSVVLIRGFTVARRNDRSLQRTDSALRGSMPHGETGNIVDSGVTGMCQVCGKPGRIHLTEIHNGRKTSRSFCREHAPPEVPVKLPRTGAEEIVLLHRLLAKIDQEVLDDSRRAQMKSEIEQLIKDIETGRRRLDDAESQL